MTSLALWIRDARRLQLKFPVVSRQALQSHTGNRHARAGHHMAALCQKCALGGGGGGGGGSVPPASLSRSEFTLQQTLPQSICPLGRHWCAVSDTHQSTYGRNNKCGLKAAGPQAAWGWCCCDWSTDVYWASEFIKTLLVLSHFE